MKKILAAVLVLLTLFASTVGLQVRLPALSSYDVVARTRSVVVMVDTGNAVIDRTTVSFSMLMAAVLRETAVGIALDHNNHIFVSVTADCGSRKFAVTGRRGRIGGRAFAETPRVVAMTVAAEDSLEDAVIGYVCYKKGGMVAE
ncbi:MAG: hypothetical protein ACK4S4_15755 [Pyrinomonadaceae bacterium]